MSPTVEQGISVWQLTDYEWFAATDRESAIACALELWGTPRQDAIEQCGLEIDAQPDDLDTSQINVAEDEQDSELISFRDQIKRLIDDGTTFPCFFSGIDA